MAGAGSDQITKDHIKSFLGRHSDGHSEGHTVGAGGKVDDRALFLGTFSDFCRDHALVVPIGAAESDYGYVVFDRAHHPNFGPVLKPHRWASGYWNETIRHADRSYNVAPGRDCQGLRSGQ